MYFGNCKKALKRAVIEFVCLKDKFLSKNIVK